MKHQYLPEELTSIEIYQERDRVVMRIAGLAAQLCEVNQQYNAAIIDLLEINREIEQSGL